jgi:tRNA A-37 threonylcarbamoyl transferase component Bud32/dipeptidyl aminopeptidase/acylaminoacyl peptidase
MPLQPGTRIGLFEITGSLGEGGMGEVYRARDSRLHRDVAIKILPAAFVSDPDRVARFTREAQSLAALNHPHIAQIYGVEEGGDHRALIMELVEGETLAERLARPSTRAQGGPLPIDEALPVARQIAEALEAAHEAGIIHRDLKPANIKLRADGSVKVLDFGLAKALHATETAPASDASLLNSPTITSPAMTQAGIILGTACYMAPEQAKGKAVDRRADIWAFGCVLFEMLTARTLFAGDTVAETLARVIEREPDLSLLPATTPPAVRTLLTRCLQRDPRKRLRDIGEARVTLEDPTVESPAAPAPAPAVSWLPVALLLVVTAAAAAGIATWLVGRNATATPAERRFALATPNDARVYEVSLAPDGTALLMVADDKLWLQSLDSFAATAVPGSDGARAPFWSQDSTSFGFQSRDQLWRVARSGGPPVSIGRVPDFALSGGAAWLPDGDVVYTTGGSGLMRLPAAGGVATPLFALDPEKDFDIHDLSALPDGRGLLYILHPNTGHFSIELFDLASSSRHTLYTPQEPPGASSPIYTSTGHVLFEQPSGVWALPTSLGDRRATGAPALVAPNARGPSVAADGTVVMIPGGGMVGEAGLAWIDRAGRTLRTIAEPRGSLFGPRLSPDGRFAVAARGTPTDSDLWIYDLASGAERRLTFEAGLDGFATWSPDGRHVVYRCELTICARRADGAGTRVQLLDPPALSPAVSPDGKWLAFVKQGAGDDWDIFVVPLTGSGLSAKATAEPRVLVGAPRVQNFPEISPDGRYVAYSSAENGAMSAYVSQFPSGEGKWQLPIAGVVTQPRWSASGDRLFVSDELDRIVEFPVDRTRLFEIGAPLARVPANVLTISGYDLSHDGSQFLVPIPPAGAAAAARLLVIQHWRPAQ